MTYRVRAMTAADLDAVARIHRSELDYGLFPALGSGFLRAYHRAFIESPHAIGLVAVPDDQSAREDGSEPAALAVGTTAQAAHHRWMLRSHGLPLALHGAIGALTHPRAWPLLAQKLRRYVRILGRLGAALPERVRRTPRRRGEPVARRPERDPMPVAVFMHLAVSPHARGHGLGRALAESFTDRVLEAGCRDLRLVTAHADEVGPFYEALGWRPAAERERDGATVTEYRFPAETRARAAA